MPGRDHNPDATILPGVLDDASMMAVVANPLYRHPSFPTWNYLERARKWVDRRQRFVN